MLSHIKRLHWSLGYDLPAIRLTHQQIDMCCFERSVKRNLFEMIEGDWKVFFAEVTVGDGYMRVKRAGRCFDTVVFVDEIRFYILLKVVQLRGKLNAGENDSRWESRKVMEFDSEWNLGC